MNDPEQTPLHALHGRLGARMVAFAGYDMPVQYPAGVLAEHRHCRAAAGLFDVSHMGQLSLRAADGTADRAARALENLVPSDLCGLPVDRQRYGLLTNDGGGIRDDMMVANRGDHLFVVVNAACKADDLAHLRAQLPDDIEITAHDDRALLAVQGPAAETALTGILTGLDKMRFMDVATLDSPWGTLWVSRSGYTGEDGFEISLPAGTAQDFATTVLASPHVQPIGLGARDSLRLEAGLCLYGADIDSETTPVEAGLSWAIQKARRTGGARAGGFPGADRILAGLAEGPARCRVGPRPEGKAPMRAGVPLFAEDTGGTPIGSVTSGGFGPTIGGPVAMGYLARAVATPGTRVFGELRGKRLPVRVVPLPFVPANFRR